MTSAEEVGRVAVLGTGLMGTSIAMASARANCDVSGWDRDPETATRAAAAAGFDRADSMAEACVDADLAVVCTPLPEIAGAVVAALAAGAGVVTDVGSVKSRVVADVGESAPAGDLHRFVGGHPMGGSERSGPEHASASIVDGIIWALTPTGATGGETTRRVADWVERLGAHPMELDPQRHDRLVAVVSHLPQVASTTLMGLAAAEEASEPEILLLAAGGFRDLTRLAGSNPGLWSEILLANRDAIVDAIDRYRTRLDELRALVADERADDVEAAFASAKAARLTLAAKPTVRAGVGVV